MARLTLTDIAAGYSLIGTINANNALIEAFAELSYQRDGEATNTLTADMDVNSNKLTNLAAGTNNSDAITLKQLNDASIVALTIAASAATLADAGANYVATTVEAAFTELASVASGEGASIIGFEDSGAKFVAVDVEAAIVELGDLFPSVSDPSATLTAEGLIELATAAEVLAATDAVRAVTPATLTVAGSFTATLTGMTTATTGTIDYVIVGKVVTMFAEANILGTSNTTAMTMTGIPAAIQNAALGLVPCVVEDNSTLKPGMFIQTAAGSAAFHAADAAALLATSNFTAANLKGINKGWSVTFPLLA